MSHIQQIRLYTAIFASIILTACGSDNKDEQTPPLNKDEQTTTLSIATVEASAIEKSNQFAKFIISRTDVSKGLQINYTVSGNSDPTKGSASIEDFTLIYSDNNNVINGTIELNENQNSRVIEVHPIQDSLHEVAETLTLSLNAASNSSYQLSSNSSATITIIDAENTNENAKVFTGTFSPQDGAMSSASGQLSLILQGDNEAATVTYSFYGLSSNQVTQHIHVSPSGNHVKGIEDTGSLTDYHWDLSPADIYPDKQSMLDALFNGHFYINIHTENYPAGEIYASLNYQADQVLSDVIALTEEEVDHDIIRFLNQATFGATPQDYQALRSDIAADGSNRHRVYESWIDNQIAQDSTSLLILTDASRNRFRSNCGDDGNCLKVDQSRSRRDAFWTTAVFAKDQLRQRVAFALSEIAVIGDDTRKLKAADKGTAHYWDQLAGNAFSSYRQIIEDVSLSPIMGHWLSHIKNQKADPEAGTFPDENYAREIMQLFSFGLIHKNNNGTPALDQNNLSIETYDNLVIKALARVFTGLSYAYYADDNNTYGSLKVENTLFSRSDNATADQYRYLNPMKFFPEYHDYEEKVLWTDNGRTVVVNATTVPSLSNGSEQAAYDELDFVLDELVKHSATAPVISEKLIQRFVTSNPSTAYIERVATAFGDTGDMTAVVKAILLDREARDPRYNTSTTFGKFKEPLLHMTGIWRLFDVHSNIAIDDTIGGLNLTTANLYEGNASILRTDELDLGQRALGSPSVFNFFLPSYIPSGELASQSIKAPELQLITETQVYSTFNTYDDLLTGKIYRTAAINQSDATEEELRITLTESIFNQWWNSTAGTNNEKANAVIQQLDFYLNGGHITRNTEDKTLSILSAALATVDEKERFNLAIYAIAIAPSFNIQK